MKSLFRPAIIAACVGLSAALPAPAFATATCSVSASALAFGAFAPIDGANHDSDATIAVDCSTDSGPEQVGVTVALDGGGGGSIAARRMQAGTGELAYNIYTDPVRSVLWGDGTTGSAPGATLDLAVTGQSVRQEFPAYGRVPAGQNTAPVGLYADSVLVTVVY